MMRAWDPSLSGPSSKGEGSCFYDVCLLNGGGSIIFDAFRELRKSQNSAAVMSDDGELNTQWLPWIQLHVSVKS